jgi:gliding motility-associated-like protein
LTLLGSQCFTTGTNSDCFGNALQTRFLDVSYSAGEFIYVRLWDENNSASSRPTVYAICGGANNPSVPNNENCASPTYISNNGACAGSNWNAPSGGFPSLGSNNCSWGLNENPVFYEFTATATTMTLNVNGVRCLAPACNGIGSSLQFAVFPKVPNCSNTSAGSRINAVGNSAQDCYIGVGTVGGSFDGLVVGQRYIIILDGLNGARCSWTGISINNAAPLPTLNTPSDICAGNPATLTINGWLSSYSVTWTANPADPSLSSQQNNSSINVTPNQTTVYTATINLGSNGNLCSGQSASAYQLTATVTVSGATAGTGNTVNVCPTDPAINLFNSLGGSPATSGTWSGPSVLGNGNLGTFNPANMTPGAYTYTVTPSGCPSTSAIINVIVPAISNQPTSANICANGSATLSVTANNGPYQWQYNNGGTWQNVVNGTPAGFSYANQTTNTLSITTNNAPCSAPQFRVLVGASACPVTSNTAAVTVLRANRIAPTGQQCSGTPLNFDVCPAGATYSWTVIPPSGTSATPTSGNGQTFSFTPTNNSGSNQTFTINSTVSISGLSCPQTFIPTIISPPTATVNNPTVCFGNNATVTASPNPAGTYNYIWTVPSGVANPGNVSSFTTSVAGNYSVIVSTTGSPSCSSSSISGTVTVTPQPQQPTLACYETATFNTTTCAWVVSGTQPVQPAVACYETAIFNTTSCTWNVSGTQPAQPTLACYETATFNTTTCVWDVTGTQPVQPTLACYETATFNTTSCAWNVTGTQPVQPSLACYETATFNTTTCAWVVSGTQPVQPTLACYETAIFNTTTCVWDVSVTTPSINNISLTICDGESYFVGGGLQNTSGLYSDTLISANGCDSIINTKLNVITFNVEAIAETDTVPIGNSTELEAYSDSFIITYLWQPSSGLDCNNCPNPVATPTATTNYTVVAIDSYGCIDSSFVTVHVLNDTSLFKPDSDTIQICQKAFYVPNAFTPNGDGKNDVFYTYGKGISQIYLQIFDRWGELVFESDDINKGWDGAYKGVLLNPGVFVYHVKTIFCDDSTAIPNVQKKGSVTLIR